MKTAFRRSFIILVVLLCVVIGVFLYHTFRGLNPAFGPAPSDITSYFSTGSKGTISQPAVNTTEFPQMLPDGFTISIYARDLGNPRVMTRDPHGTLLVSVSSQGEIIALSDADSDGVSDENTRVLGGLNRPHGIAFYNNKLYVAETDSVSAYDYDWKIHRASNKQHILDLPAGGNHHTRTIGFGPDGKLYVSIGSSCNVCRESDWRRAAIIIANPDGSDVREFATGLRNSVFFVWHPESREMWATDMGRDLIGDNIPPEEVNIVLDGGFYGWPFCYGDRVHDRSFDSSDEVAGRCTRSAPPHITFQAHSAPLGLAFVPDSWPQEYRGDLLVAYHGSWNRTVPTGYKIARFDLDNQLQSTGESDFISGWLTQDGAFGRPVDLLFDDNGNLFITDDKAGVIYRVAAVH